MANGMTKRYLPVLWVFLTSVLVGGLFDIGWAAGVGIAPEVNIAEDGKITVSWQTDHDCSGARVSFGMDFADDPFGSPHYRVRASAKGGSRKHTAEASLKDIEDIAKGRTFNGKVFYRAVCFDRRDRTWLDTGDCVFRYLKRDGSYKRVVAIIEGPIIANVKADSVLVRWVTDMPSAGRVSLAEKGWPSPDLKTEHEVILQGLQPDAVYSYTVEVSFPSEDAYRSRPYSFRTAPRPGSPVPFAFGVFSDTRAHDHTPVAIEALNGVNARVLRQIALGAFHRQARFTVVPGDLISGVTSNAEKARLQLRSWKKAVTPIARFIPFYTGLGNHDAEIYDRRDVDGKSVRVRKTGQDNAEEMFRREMTNPTNGPDLPPDSDDPTYIENVYSFDYGNSHFVMLNNDYKDLRGTSDDSEKGKIIGRQLGWLRQDLASASQRGQQNIFVFFHEPAFPNGGHLGDSMYDNGNEEYVKPRNEFWRLLCQHNVVAAFCGHEHNYSRTLVDETVDASFSRPIWQIVTGGGGAPFHNQDKPPWRGSVRFFSPRQHYCLIVVEESRVQIRAYDLAGNVIDQADLR